MDDATVLHHLEELTTRLGIELRYEAAAGRAGLCVLRGRRVAVVDDSLRVPERVEALMTILAEEPIEDVYLPPAVRERILAEKAKHTTGDQPPPRQ